MAKKVNKIKSLKKAKDNTAIPVKSNKLPQLKSKEQKALEALAKREDGTAASSTISTTKSQSKTGKAWDILSHPMTAMELKTKKGYVPDGFKGAVEKGVIKANPFEIATDVVNPVAMVEYIKGLPKDIKEGNYGEALLKGASMLPMVKGITKRALGKKKIRNAPIKKERPLTYAEKPLAEDMKPYLSRYEKPISREQEVFESSLGTKYQSKKTLERTVHLDNKGNKVPTPKDYNKLVKTNTTNMKTRKKVKPNQPPKHIWGALLGAATSIVGGAINNSKQKKLANQQALTQHAVDARIDKDLLEEYPEEGYNVESYYQAKGGKLANPNFNTKGGKLLPISSDMVLAKGNKHNESNIDNTSGIKLLKGGKAIAEIEDGETIKDDRMVYSDKTLYKGNKTYADEATRLSKEKGILEKNINRGSSINKNTSKRKLALVDYAENKLFAHQENNKTMAKGGGLPKYNGGGFGLQGSKEEEEEESSMKPFDFKGIGNKVAPYIDNITNLALTAMTPKIAKPRLQKPVNLKTEINVNPQLRTIRDAVASTTKSIKQNSSSSATARAEMSGVRLAGTKQRNDVFVQKENIETGLVNKNRLNKQNVSARNLAKLDRYDDKNFARSTDINARLSANAANIAGDYIDKRNYDATQAFNKERLDIARQYSTNGTSERADLLNPTEIAKIQSDPTYANEQRERYKNQPKELARLEVIIRNANLATPNI